MTINPVVEILVERNTQLEGLVQGMIDLINKDNASPNQLQIWRRVADKALEKNKKKEK